MTDEGTAVEQRYASLMEEAGHGRPQPSGKGERLSSEQRRFLFMLGLPTLGLSLCLTLASTYMPTFIQRLAGPLVTGGLIGTEGLFGLFVPVLAGSWSDHARSRFGGRLVFLVVAAPVAAATLVLMPLIGTLAAIALLLPIFYIAYFTYYPPYRALYPDLVPSELRGRSQGIQKALREGGLGLALVGGGLLLALWPPLPFIIGAAILLGITAIVYFRVSDPKGETEESEGHAPRPRELYREVRQLVVDEPPLRRVLVANSLWELALAALRAFVILFITVGLGRTSSAAAGVLAIAGVGVVIGALTAGKLADRVGHRRLVLVAIVVYGCGAFVPAFSQALWILAIVFIVAIAAGIVMALPYSMMMTMMPETEHGVAAGVYELSRGVGVLLGPVIAGIAVQLLAPVFPLTKGYAAIFLVTGAAILISLFFVWRVPRAATDPEKR